MTNRSRTSTTAAELPELLLPDVEAWREWLAEHQDDDHGVRLVLAKKGGAAPTTLTYADALQEALCYGWIDGQSGRRDAGSWFVRFTPRRSRSIWSQRNVGYVARLTEQGRMQPRGLAEVARAQADGRWAAAYAGPASIEVPPELIDALAQSPEARAAWEGLDGQNRYAILHRVVTAVKPETRARRIQEFVAMLARGETLYPPRGAGRKAGPAEPPGGASTEGS
jgi:uncharacterized protein YdeI (YjbR/CyaY-like superfamily)